MIVLSNELNQVIEEWNAIQPDERLHLDYWLLLDNINDPSSEKEMKEYVDFIQEAINDYKGI